MDESRVKEIVDKNIGHLKRAVQLQQWECDVRREAIGNKVPAQCQPMPGYRQAIIKLDSAELDDEEDLMDSLRHELLHCMISSFETYRKGVGELIDGTTFNALDVMFKRACEETVGNIERMLDHGLGLTPKKMIEWTKEVIKSRDEE